MCLIKNNTLEKLVQEHKSGKKLIFIHTPKCAGTYLIPILNLFNIQYNEHHQAISSEDIYFTVIRNPVNRFESLLNYRLGLPKIRDDWPKQLHHVFNNTQISLNEIVSSLTDDEILGFVPYRTLTYWTVNVDIIITIDELPKLLKLFGYEYNIEQFEKANVSNKLRGNLNDYSKERISKLFHNDMVLYEKVIASSI